MLLKELLSEREIPKLKSREEMLQIMQEEVYGYLPAKPNKVSFVVTENIVNNFCAGKAVLNKVIAECTIGSKVFSFPFLQRRVQSPCPPCSCGRFSAPRCSWG